ncbi:MAG: GAF domain-containing protein [Chloroflexi bacterium]|nr:GAF domain-containing protein [Chloroflexota bacterium]
MKLQYRMILTVVLSLFVVMLIFGYLGRWALGKSNDADAEARLVLAEAIASHLDGMMDHSIGVLKKTAEFPGIMREDADLGLKREILRDTAIRLGGFAEIRLLDMSGKVVAGEPPKLATDDTDFFLTHPAAGAALITGEPQVAEWRSQIDGGKTLACLSVPVRNQSRAIIGVLMAELDPDATGFHITLHSADQGAVAVELVNQNLVLASSSETGIRYRRNVHANIIAQFLRERRAGVVVHDVPGLPRHTVAYAPMVSVPGWGVLMEQPLYTTLDLAQDLERQLFAFGAISLIVAVTVAWVDIRRVVKPINALTLAAARIGSGDLASPIPRSQRVDEIGTLTESVETMRQRLRDLIDKREQYEADLEKEAEQRAGEVTALLAASEAFTSTLDLSVLLNIILTESRRVCPDADAGVMVMLEPHLGRLVPVASFGCDIEALREARLRPGEGVIGRVFESGRPVCLPDRVLTDENLNLTPENSRTFKAAGLTVDGSQYAMCVPLVAKRGTLGILIVYDFKEPSSFSQAGLKALQAIAYQAAIALDNAQLYEEVQQKEELRGRLLMKVITAQEEERRRIARELHDGFAQALAVVRMSLEAIEAGRSDIPDAQRERLGQAKALSERALTDVRQMILDLRPTVLDDIGLGAAIRSYAQQRLEVEDIRVNVSILGLQERMATQVETEVYRILQEAITNIAKHAGATKAWIRLRCSDGLLMASVEDNGRGFQLEDVGHAADGRQLGLLGMRERVELLGGSLVIRSLPGKGTQLTIKVPIAEGG